MKNSIFRNIGMCFITVLVIVIFSACGNSSVKELDIIELSEKLSSEIKFSDELEKADNIMISLLFDTPEEVKVELYTGNGSYADELAIFECDTDENISKTEEAIQIHLEELKESFSNYIPEEAAKVDDAIVVKQEKYIVLCVSSDETAFEIINNALK